MSGNFRSTRSPNVIWTSYSSLNFRLVGMNEYVPVCIVFHVCAVSEVAPALSWSLIRGGSPCPCVVKKVCMWYKDEFPPPTGHGYVRSGGRVSRKRACEREVKLRYWDDKNVNILHRNHSYKNTKILANTRWLCTVSTKPSVDSVDPVVIILASGSEVRGFDPRRGRWIFFFRA